MPNNTLVKIGIVVAGYILALVGALIAVFIQMLTTEGPNAQASSGMYAFGDAILFLVVLGGLALVPTTLAFIFLRPMVKFWNVFALLCLVFSITRPIVVIVNTLMNANGGYASYPFGLLLSLMGVLGIFAAPVFAVGFLILAIIAPSARSRLLMFIAAGCEGLAALYVLINFLFSQRFF